MELCAIHKVSLVAVPMQAAEPNPVICLWKHPSPSKSALQHICFTVGADSCMTHLCSSPKLLLSSSCFQSEPQQKHQSGAQYMYCYIQYCWVNLRFTVPNATSVDLHCRVSDGAEPSSLTWLLAAHRSENRGLVQDSGRNNPNLNCKLHKQSRTAVCRGITHQCEELQPKPVFCQTVSIIGSCSVTFPITAAFRGASQLCWADKPNCCLIPNNAAAGHDCFA